MPKDLRGALSAVLVLTMLMVGAFLLVMTLQTIDSIPMIWVENPTNGR